MFKCVVIVCMLMFLLLFVLRNFKKKGVFCIIVNFLCYCVGNWVMVWVSFFGFLMIIVLMIGWLFVNCVKFILVILRLFMLVFILVYWLVLGVIKLWIWLKVWVLSLNFCVSVVICLVVLLLMICWWIIFLVLIFVIIELL